MKNPRCIDWNEIKKTKKFAKDRRTICFALAGLVGTCAMLPITAFAKTTAELEKELQELQEQINQHKKELEELEDVAANESVKKANIEAQIELLKEQINLKLSHIQAVQESINIKEQEIEAKTLEIAQKQTEYDSALTLFRERLGAMQEMNDNGMMSILSAVENLYQLLTFQQTLQDIADHDQDQLNLLETQRKNLETAKADLLTAKTALEEQYTQLEAEMAELEAMQAEFNQNLLIVSNSIAEAEAAQKEMEELIKQDNIKFAELEAEIAALIAAAGGNYGDLVFGSNFNFPIASGSFWISQGFHSGHPGVDYASPEGTPIYATASGYITASGWNNGGYGNYVLMYHGDRDGETFSSLYAHMVDRPIVAVGQYVAQGAVLGYVGSTGRSTGNHLHYELWAGSNINNSVANKATRVNPANYPSHY